MTIQIQNPDYDSDPRSGLRSGFFPDRTDFHAIFTRGVSPPKDQSIKFGDNPDYNPDLGHSPSKNKKIVHNKHIYYLTANYSTTTIFV